MNEGIKHGNDGSLGFNEYQAQAWTTNCYPPEHVAACLVAGLCSEAGEVAGKFKKALREGSDAAGLSALADIRAALGVGEKPMLSELAGLVREKVERVRELEAVAVAAKAYVDHDVGAHNAVKRLRALWGALSAAGYLKEAE